MSIPRIEPPLLVGLDVGSGSVRALVFDAGVHEVARAAVPTPSVALPRGLVDYEPEALWQAVLTTLGQALALVPTGTPVAGIAVASVGESAVPVDAAGKPTHNAIAWFDTRTADQARWLRERLGPERIFALTGLAAEPMFGLTKLLWLRDEAPDAFARTVRWLNIADWIAFRLSGEAATDYSLASRTLALDLTRRAWAADMLAEIGLTADLFAPLKPSGSALGPVRADVAAALGLPAGVIVGVGGHDHVCGAMAAGAAAPGILLDSMGTAEALYLPTAAPRLDPVVLARGYAQGTVAVDAPHFYLMGGIHHAGGAIEWFRQTLADGADHAALIEAAAEVPAGSGGVCFVPHLRRSQMPHPDTRARGAFFGLTAETTRGALFRAVLEGLALEARLGLDGMLTLPGAAPLQEIRVIGGNVQNALLLKIKASVYGVPLILPAHQEGSSLGAAMLGGIAAGVFDSLADALSVVAGERRSVEQRSVEPEPAWVEAYAGLFEDVYRGAYAALRPLSHALDALDAGAAATGLRAKKWAARLQPCGPPSIAGRRRRGGGASALGALWLTSR